MTFITGKSVGFTFFRLFFYWGDKTPFFIMENKKEEYFSRYVFIPKNRVINPQQYPEINGYLQIPKKDILNALGLRW